VVKYSIPTSQDIIRLHAGLLANKCCCDWKGVKIIGINKSHSPYFACFNPGWIFLIGGVGARDELNLCNWATGRNLAWWIANSVLRLSESWAWYSANWTDQSLSIRHSNLDKGISTSGAANDRIKKFCLVNWRDWWNSIPAVIMFGLSANIFIISFDVKKLVAAFNCSQPQCTKDGLFIFVTFVTDSDFRERLDFPVIGNLLDCQNFNQSTVQNLASDHNQGDWDTNGRSDQHPCYDCLN